MDIIKYPPKYINRILGKRIDIKYIPKYINKILGKRKRCKYDDTYNHKPFNTIHL